MYHDVDEVAEYVNIMDQDVTDIMNQDAAAQDAALGVTMTVAQAEIAYLRQLGRLGEYAVVYRAWRQQAGGGFGDQERNPLTWGVLVYIDGQLARVYSARGVGREWSNLDRLERWLRSQGFWYWWTRNDLESLGDLDSASGEDDVLEPVSPP